MLLLIFFIAILNLAIGYALGAGLTLGSLLELLPRRAPKAESLDIEEDEALTRPAAPAAPAAIASPPPNPKPSPAEVMASLSSFREKLTSASVELKLDQEDPKRFEETANRLQAVNHAYLSEAEGAIQHLDKLSAAGDTVAGATSKAVAKGKGQVEALSGELDGLIDAGLEDGANREKLIAKAEQLRENTESVEAATSAAMAKATSVPAPAAPAAEPPAEKTKPKSLDFASFDQLFDRLEAVLAEADPEATHHVAAIRVDPIADHESNDSLIAGIEEQVAVIARELMEEGQAFVAGRPAMAVLDGDDFDGATTRLERLRQQIEATTFQTASGEVRATVTCAVADTHAGDSREKVIEQLNMALDESVRQGANHTFHHDGAFTTPIEKISVTVEPKTVTA